MVQTPGTKASVCGHNCLGMKGHNGLGAVLDCRECKKKPSAFMPKTEARRSVGNYKYGIPGLEKFDNERRAAKALRPDRPFASPPKPAVPSDPLNAPAEDMTAAMDLVKEAAAKTMAQNVIKNGNPEPKNIKRYVFDTTKKFGSVMTISGGEQDTDMAGMDEDSFQDNADVDSHAITFSSAARSSEYFSIPEPAIDESHPSWVVNTPSGTPAPSPFHTGATYHREEETAGAMTPINEEGEDDEEYAVHAFNKEEFNDDGRNEDGTSEDSERA